MAEDRPPRGPQLGWSRRDFLKGIGAGALAAGWIEEADLSAAAADLIGPEPASVRLSVNGVDRVLTLEPRTTLLAALRDHLDLTGAKQGCDRGGCGVCTVLLDGQAVPACMVLALDAEGQQVQTVEGLADHDRLHPVQAAFIEHDAMQCGFCTPGMVMAAVALLARHPDPTPAQIRGGLSGNLCRCGAYPNVIEAVERAAQRLKGTRA